MDEQANEYVGIGPLAEQLGVSRSVIRLWERKGWIDPAPRLLGSDRRVYRLNDAEAIRSRVEEMRAAKRRPAREVVPA